MPSTGPRSVSARLPALRQRLREALAAAGGWLPFDRFMALALYEPGLGYYSGGARQFGRLPASGSDFVTAPELSPLFGQTLAHQVAQGLELAGADEVFEFGAGSGALAAQLLGALGGRVARYSIVDLSGALRERQAATLAPWADRVRWLDAWPLEPMRGVVVANELLDAMPVKLLHFDGQRWHERGVVAGPGETWAWSDRDTALRPPAPGPFAPGTLTEIHAQAEAFVRTLAQQLQKGLALFLDYGFPEAEYHHPQRTGGTLMCHRGHQADTNPLADVGDKDITAHVNFSAVALAAQDAGLDVLGYTSQAHFLVNCGLPALLAAASLRERADAGKLMHEHEMGELFKVLALGRGIDGSDLVGFTAGDRMHTL
jgi:SAM-dependent MidA family methyltransferase